MKTLAAFHDLTDEKDVDAAVAEIMAAITGTPNGEGRPPTEDSVTPETDEEETEVAKHAVHNQSDHGNRDGIAEGDRFEDPYSPDDYSHEASQWRTVNGDAGKGPLDHLFTPYDLHNGYGVRVRIDNGQFAWESMLFRRRDPDSREITYQHARLDGDDAEYGLDYGSGLYTVENIAKHRPGGVDHEQDLHGSWSDGSSDDPSKDNSSSAEPSGVGGGATQSPPAPSGNEATPAESGNASQPPSTGTRGVQGLPVDPATGIMTLPRPAPMEDQDFIQSVIDKYTTPAIQAKMDFIQANAGMEQSSNRFKQGIDTMGINGVWEDGKFIGYTAERAEWQKEQLLAYKAEQARKNGAKPKAERKVVVMMGQPGAGKTHLINNELTDSVDPRDYLNINADELKAHIIERDKPPVIEGITGWELSSMVHEESSTMRKRLEGDEMAKGTNIILDITGADPEKTEALLKRLTEEYGYELHLVHADVSTDEAHASALRRAARNFDPAVGTLGRIVPAPFIEGMRRGEGNIVQDNFDQFLKYATKAQWFRTFPLNAEREKADHRPTEELWNSDPDWVPKDE